MDGLKIREFVKHLKSVIIDERERSDNFTEADLQRIIDEEIYTATVWNYECLQIIADLSYYHWYGKVYSDLRHVAQDALMDHVMSIYSHLNPETYENQEN